MKWIFFLLFACNMLFLLFNWQHLGRVPQQPAITQSLLQQGKALVLLNNQEVVQNHQHGTSSLLRQRDCYTLFAQDLAQQQVQAILQVLIRQQKVPAHPFTENGEDQYLYLKFPYQASAQAALTNIRSSLNKAYITVHANTEWRVMLGMYRHPAHIQSITEQLGAWGYQVHTETKPQKKYVIRIAEREAAKRFRYLLKHEGLMDHLRVLEPGLNVIETSCMQ